MAYGKKVITEKNTGEKYGSKSEKMKHEKREKSNPKEMMKEYGKKAVSMMKGKAKKK
jgi:hypothetical protein